jgi:hypothetical protein
VVLNVYITVKVGRCVHHPRHYIDYVGECNELKPKTKLPEDVKALCFWDFEFCCTLSYPSTFLSF